jgi:N-formylglutamate amidohydrolase
MKIADSDFEPITLSRPGKNALPLVCDSPHSGVIYPRDFGAALPASILRSGEDTYVEELWRAIPAVGGTLLAANFPRSYIDPNRELSDLDAALLGEPWPGQLRPSEKTRLGIGLIWRLARKQPIYDRKLSLAEVQNRIRRYHQPYHAVLGEQIETAHAEFGAVWHLNLHSMPADSYRLLEIDTDKELADFVLGDHDGRTCDPVLVDTIDRFLTARGYKVARNDPFKGVALIARIGRPAEKRHSLQIEVNRKLYMNETSFEKSPGFGALQESLTLLAAHLAEFVEHRLH